MGGFGRDSLVTAYVVYLVLADGAHADCREIDVPTLDEAKMTAAVIYAEAAEGSARPAGLIILEPGGEVVFRYRARTEH